MKVVGAPINEQHNYEVKAIRLAIATRLRNNQEYSLHTWSGQPRARVSLIFYNYQLRAQDSRIDNSYELPYIARHRIKIILSPPVFFLLPITNLGHVERESLFESVCSQGKKGAKLEDGSLVRNISSYIAKTGRSGALSGENRQQRDTRLTRGGSGGHGSIPEKLAPSKRGAFPPPSPPPP